MKEKLLDRFRQIGFIEGISYLVLLFIAMPLKYIFDYPMATKIVGMLHGILFSIYIWLLVAAMQEYKWNIKFGIELFIASLIPFGTFYTDKKLKKIRQTAKVKNS